MNLNELARTSGEWLRGSGPESDIVMSCRIRLARNLAEFPFISRCTPADRTEVEKQLRDQVTHVHTSGELEYLSVNELKVIDRQFLVERQLISREHADSEGARGVAIAENEQVSLMVNEEDHLRIQVMHSGLDLANAWEKINRIDDKVESLVTYAYNKRLGY